jgi:RHS repeat-associated protein
MRAMPAVTALLATTASQTVLRQARPGVIQGFAYSPYGWRPSSAETATGFNGQRPEPATGGYLLGNGHRLYNPVLMRFTRPDALSPFGKGGVNAYAYCEGDPVNATDSSGKFLDLIFPGLDPKFSAIFSVVAGMAVGAANIGTGIKTFQPTAPAMKVASRVGANLMLTGSVVTVTGGILQMAGVQEGRYISAFGAGITGAGALSTGGQLARDIYAQPNRREYVQTALRRRFLPEQQPKVVPQIAITTIRGERIRQGESVA